MMRGIIGRKIGIALSFAAVLLVGCDKSGKVQDEAKQAGRAPESFSAAGEDYFKAMDNGASLRPMRSRAATCGSSEPAAATGSGT
jgi:hypothetical protein